MTKHILVYGSLKRGQPSNFLMRDVGAFMGEVRVKGYDLHKAGWYPGIRRNDDNKEGVLCELYALKDDASLDKLDAYEGYVEEAPEHSLFLREKVQVNDGPEAYIYTYNREPNPDSQVKDGVWLG